MKTFFPTLILLIALAAATACEGWLSHRDIEAAKKTRDVQLQKIIQQNQTEIAEIAGISRRLAQVEALRTAAQP